MRPSERPAFDFDANLWTDAEALHARAGGKVRELPAPTVLPEPGRWTAPRPKRRGERLQGPFLIAGTVILAATTVLYPLALLPVALLILVPLLATQANDPLVGPITDTDLRLVENPDDLDILLVALTVVRNGKALGADRGVVWFDEGRLLFNGHRTSFAIGGEDILPPSRWRELPLDTVRHGLPDGYVPLRVEAGTATIRFVALRTGNGISAAEMRFLKRLYEFRLRPPVSTGPRQWPPFES